MKLAIWAATEPEAALAARVLGLNPNRVVLVGNRSTSKVRGLTLDVILVLPSASADEAKLAEMVPALRGGRVVNLKRVQP